LPGAGAGLGGRTGNRAAGRGRGAGSSLTPSQEEAVAGQPPASRPGAARLAGSEPRPLRVGWMPLPTGGGAPLLGTHLHGRPQEAGRAHPQRAGRYGATAANPSATWAAMLSILRAGRGPRPRVSRSVLPSTSSMAM
jgi:hypothetical protein